MRVPTPSAASAATTSHDSSAEPRSRRLRHSGRWLSFVGDVRTCPSSDEGQERWRERDSSPPQASDLRAHLFQDVTFGARATLHLVRPLLRYPDCAAERGHDYGQRRRLQTASVEGPPCKKQPVPQQKIVFTLSGGIAIHTIDVTKIDNNQKKALHNTAGMG